MLWSLAFLVSIATFVRSVKASNDTACNGYDSLCSRLYSNISFLGAHNSYAVGSSISDNQHYDVTTQLNDGIRLLQGQGHNGTNEAGSLVQLCHSSCVLQDGGTLESYLAKVKTWVMANPREVITILWVNSDNMPVANWAAAYQSTGLNAYSYAPSSGTVKNWPSLQSLISAGTPVINFLTSQTNHATVPYLLGEWDNIWETPYENNDNSFTCDFDRGTRPNPLYLANHFAYKETTLLGNSIDSPDTENIDSTNSLENMNAHANLCAASNSRYPNFFLVDFYEKGSGGALQAVAAMNDVIYSNKTLGNGSLSGASSAIKSFFGGQNEIRNIAIVSAAGAVVLILIWAGCCCFWRRRTNRKNSLADDDYHKPLTRSAASFSKTEDATPSFMPRMPGQQPKYTSVAEAHELQTAYSRGRHDPTTRSAFSDISGGSRPLPTPPRYQSYDNSRTPNTRQYAYHTTDPWYDHGSRYS